MTGEPGKQQILNPLIEDLGAKFMDGMIIQQSKDFSPDLVKAYLTPAASSLSPGLNQASNNGMFVSMPNVTGISYKEGNGFLIEPILAIDSTSAWNKKSSIDFEDVEILDQSNQNATNPTKEQILSSPAKGKDPLAFNVSEGDTRGALPVAISLTRVINGKKQRILIAGDSDFLSNTELKRQNFGSKNFTFATRIFSWFTEGKAPVNTERIKGKDNRLNLSDDGLNTIKILYKFIFPGILLVIGATILIRRRRK